MTVLDLTREHEEPEYFNDLRALGFEPTRINDDVDMTTPTGHAVLSRWRMTDHPEVSCEVVDEWEGGGGNIFATFAAAWDTGSGADPHRTIDDLAGTRILTDGVRDELENRDYDLIDLRPITSNPVGDRLRALDFHQNMYDPTRWSHWTGHSTIDIRLDTKRRTARIHDDETGANTTITFNDLLHVTRIDTGWRQPSD